MENEAVMIAETSHCCLQIVSISINWMRNLKAREITWNKYRHFEKKLKCKVNTERNLAISVYSINDLGFLALRRKQAERIHISEFTQSPRRKSKRICEDGLGTVEWRKPRQRRRIGEWLHRKNTNILLEAEKVDGNRGKPIKIEKTDWYTHPRENISKGYWTIARNCIYAHTVPWQAKGWHTANITTYPKHTILYILYG